MAPQDGLGDLYDGHEGYRTPTDEQLAAVLTSGIVATDTNILLDLYRYGERARAEFLDVLRRVRDNLFVPAQVRMEFWRNRDTVLDDVATTHAKSHLGEVRRTVRKTLDTWAERTRTFEQAALLSDEADELFDRIEEAMRETAGRFDAAAALADTALDSVLAALTDILRGRVAPQPDPESQAMLIESGKQRLADEVPPGYHDAAKLGIEHGTGDYLIWEELLRRAKDTGLDVLFVTRDEKPDWWRKDRRHAFLGPRVELVAEMAERAGTAFFMVRPPDLLRIATKLLDVEVSEQTIEDASRVAGGGPESGGSWTVDTLTRLLELLEANGAWVQAEVIREAAADEDGFVPRHRVYEIGDYDKSRQLKGFTRPVMGAVAELIEDGEVPPDVEVPLVAVYSGPGKANGFAVHPSLIDALVAEPEPRDLTWIEAAQEVMEGSNDWWHVDDIVKAIAVAGLRDLSQARTPAATLRRDLAGRAGHLFEREGSRFRRVQN